MFNVQSLPRFIIKPGDPKPSRSMGKAERGEMLTSTVKITESLIGSTTPGAPRPVSPYSHHSSIGEDASRFTSNAASLSQTPMSERRQGIEHLIATAARQNVAMTYRKAGQQFDIMLAERANREALKLSPSKKRSLRAAKVKASHRKAA